MTGSWKGPSDQPRSRHLGNPNRYPGGERVRALHPVRARQAAPDSRAPGYRLRELRDWGQQIDLLVALDSVLRPCSRALLDHLMNDPISFAGWLLRVDRHNVAAAVLGRLVARSPSSCSVHVEPK